MTLGEYLPIGETVVSMIVHNGTVLVATQRADAGHESAAAGGAGASPVHARHARAAIELCLELDRMTAIPPEIAAAAVRAGWKEVKGGVASMDSPSSDVTMARRIGFLKGQVLKRCHPELRPMDVGVDGIDIRFVDDRLFYKLTPKPQ